jgi:diguanylate cyclase
MKPAQAFVPQPQPLFSLNAAPARRRRTYRQIYPLRVLGMGLGTLVVAYVLHEQQAPQLHWWAVVTALLLWPHLAYLLFRFSTDPYRAEIRNLLIDSAITGLCVPLMHFNLLPSVVLMAITTYDKFSTGIKDLGRQSLPGMLGMAVLGTLILRPTPQLESSLAVVVCTLPVLLVHSFAVSKASYRLIRTVARQNHLLQELHRTDTHTGLYTRDHWQEQASEAWHQFQATGQPACLLMIDIDHFKPINDRHGHTVGDEAIRAVGQAILGCVRSHDCAGRYGGDEFIVVCGNTQESDALAIAQRIRARVERLRLAHLPQLRLTSSIGLAAVGPQHGNLLDWMHDADTALYRAKHGGRNRVESAVPQAFAGAMAAAQV